MHRYIGIVWNSDIESARSAQSLRRALTSQPAEWHIAYDGPGMLVVHAGTQYGSRRTYSLKNNSGVVLGTVFDRQHRNYATVDSIRFDEKTTQQIVSSGGRHLIDNYWGSYVAFVHDESRRRHHVFHDPTSATPCHHIRHQEVDVFFYDIEDCARLLPIAFSISPRWLARWLVEYVESSHETCLENVQELLVGEGMTICRGQATRTFLWNPIEIAQTPRFEHIDDAAQALRSTAQNTINAWAACYSEIVLRLSGGLDSSIVAGCLAQAPSAPRVGYLNMSSDMTFDQEPLSMPGYDKRIIEKTQALSVAGDERYFARLIAERWKTRLVETRLPMSPDLSNMWKVPKRTRPHPDLLGTHLENIYRELMTRDGAQALFTGQAGDYIFFASWMPLGAIDHAYLHGIRPNLWPHLIAACNLSKLSLWTVLRRVFRYGVLEHPVPPNKRFLATPKLLRDEWIKDLATEIFDSPIAKLADSAKLPPGKRIHIGGLGTPGYYNCAPHRDVHVDHIHPLNSQPLWEVMLQVPTYNLQAGGVSRGLARRAFADVLPAEIRRRQSKGSGTPIAQHHLRKNKEFLRKYLEDGLLVQGGYVDRRKLTECLAADNPSLVVNARHLTKCLAAEIWMRQWEEHSKRGSEDAQRDIRSTAP